MRLQKFLSAIQPTLGLLLGSMFLGPPGAVANSSLAMERSGNFLVVFAQAELPVEGEEVLVQLTGNRSCALRVLPENHEHPRDQCVIIGEAVDLAQSKAKTQDCRRIPICSKSRTLAGECKEAQVFVRHGEPTQIQFPGEIVGGFKRKKPIIYLYPREKTEVTISLDFQGVLEASHPALRLPERRWSVIAYPDGRIVNKADGEEFSSLFWEGSGQEIPYDPRQGFIVAGKDIKDFLQSSLRKLGLTSREYNEFIAYWYPILKDNGLLFIHFATSEYERNVKLNVQPVPDTVIRIFMIYHPVKKAITVAPQILEPSQRHGFTIVEWGGGEANPRLLHLK